MEYVFALIKLVSIACVLILVYGLLYLVWLESWLDYRRARKEVIPWVQSYKARCRGNNRFVVTVPDLQDAFREYGTDTLEKVWKDLVNQKIIQQDPMDNEWCVR